jgi:serine/threonine protein kinase
MDFNELHIDKRYKIVSSLGEGAMGAVFLANDLKLDRKVAIKVIRKEVRSNAGIFTRTKNEGMMLSKLRHPSLASVFEMNMTSQSPYIVQEFISGKDLRHIINRGVLFDEDQAWRFFREQADVLSYLHSKDIVHRDIKPENIIIDSSGKSILMDFGLALSSEFTRLTKEGSFVGTMKYCSPEVLKGKDGGERTDVYQLGLVVYEAMTGLSLIGKFSSIEQFVATLYKRSWEDGPLDTRVPSGLAFVIKKACRFAASERPANGSALVELIEQASKGMVLPPAKAGKKSFSQKVSDRKESHTKGRHTNPGISGHISSDKTTENGSSSIIRKIGGAALILLTIFICALYISQTKRRVPVVVVSTDNEAGANLFSQCRAFLTTPTGFYLFLPYEVGNSLHWSLNGQEPLRGNEREVTGKFTRVAGGWKALLRSLDCPAGAKARLSVYDGNKEIASKDIEIEKTLLKEPFEAIFSYDRIFVKWKFHGFSSATIVVREIKKGLNTGPDIPETSDSLKYVKAVEAESTIILGSEIGFGGKMRLSLHLPFLLEAENRALPGRNERLVNEDLPESEVAFVTGAKDMELKLQISPENISDDNFEANANFSLDNDSRRKITGMVKGGNHLYLTTNSGHIFCFEVDSGMQSILKFLWKKSLRDIRDFKDVKEPLDDVYPPELIPTCLLPEDDGVHCYGLGDGSAVYSFDKNGRYSKSMVPYFSDKEAWQKHSGDEKPAKVYKFSSGKLYVAALESPGLAFFQADGSPYPQKIEVFNDGCCISSAKEGMGKIFCWVRRGNYRVLCTIEMSSASCRLNEIASFPFLKKKYGEISMAFDNDLKVGLYSVNGELNVLRESKGIFLSEKVSPHIADGMSVNGVVRTERGQFTCVALRGTSNAIIPSDLTSTVNFIEVSLGPDSDRLESTIRETNRHILKESYRCNLIGPEMIDEKSFCFNVGTFFYIVSTEKSEILYSWVFFAAPEKLIVDKNIVLLTKYYYGAVFGLHLNRFD